jgi:hypothetical protein
MHLMRESWTDARLDDMNRRMEDGFNRVDAELRALNGRFDALQRTLLQIGGGLIATLVAGFFGLILTQL